jgi:hypothetical protein
MGCALHLDSFEICAEPRPGFVRGHRTGSRMRRNDDEATRERGAAGSDGGSAVDVLGRTQDRERERLEGEIRQLLGVRRLRVRLYGAEDAELLRIDRMIRERRALLAGAPVDA